MPSLNDYMFAWYSASLPASFSSAGTFPAAGSQVQNSITASSTTVSGSQTAPTAGTTVATTGALTGMYKIRVLATFSGSGTPVAADTINLQITAGSLTLNHYVDVTPGRVNDATEFFFRASAQAVVAKAIGNATANVAYNVTIVATPIAS